MSENATILVVDDSAENLRLLVAMLKGQKFHVRPARDGQMAVTSACNSLLPRI